MTAYLDASVIVPYIFPETTTPIVTRFIREGRDTLIVSTMAAGEVASAASRLLRTAIVPRESVALRMAALDLWLAADVETIGTESIDIDLAGRFVRRFDLGLRMPDAIHAATCVRLDLTLVTFDTRLARAACALGIEVMIPA